MLSLLLLWDKQREKKRRRRFISFYIRNSCFTLSSSQLLVLQLENLLITENCNLQKLMNSLNSTQLTPSALFSCIIKTNENVCNEEFKVWRKKIHLKKINFVKFFFIMRWKFECLEIMFECIEIMFGCFECLFSFKNEMKWNELLI